MYLTVSPKRNCRDPKEEQSVSIHKLCKLLFASESTIRRDLTYLEQQGVINRYYGGATMLLILRLNQAYL